jgi:hypothetical protein
VQYLLCREGVKEWSGLQFSADLILDKPQQGKMAFTQDRSGENNCVSREESIGLLHLTHGAKRFQRERRDLSSKRGTALAKDTAIAQAEAPTSQHAPTPAPAAAPATLQHGLITREHQQFEFERGQ